MSETANYKLYLTGSSEERFLDWREKMNGKSDSNMQKIDRALGEKADKSSSIHAVLSADAWTGSEAPFVQELVIDGLPLEKNGSISVDASATAEQRNTARCAMLSLTGQSPDGTLTISADGDLPEQDIPVLVILFG